MEKEVIQIVCNIDTSYVKYCIVMLTSLLENNKNERICVHLIASELTDEARIEILEVVEGKYGQTICFYLIGEEILQDCSIYGDSHISLATYYRIFLCSILPADLSKALYLDCDLVVLGSINELWNTDISQYAVACVEDMWSGKPDNYERLHYASSDSYFNAGVLLVNLDYWRELDFEGLAMAYIKAHHSELVFNDQDVLNALLHDRKLFLPFRWNVQDGFLRRKRRIRQESIAMLDEELKSPVIIHYTGGKKPWQYKSVHPYKSFYYFYLDKTRWRGERPVVPFSYKSKLALDKFMCFCKLAKPKYLKPAVLCVEN